MFLGCDAGAIDVVAVRSLRGGGTELGTEVALCCCHEVCDPHLGGVWKVAFHRAAGQSVGHLVIRESAMTEDVLEGDVAASMGKGPQVGPDLFLEWVSLGQGARLQGSDRTLTMRGNEDSFAPPHAVLE